MKRLLSLFFAAALLVPVGLSAVSAQGNKAGTTRTNEHVVGHHPKTTKMHKPAGATKNMQHHAAKPAHHAKAAKKSAK